MSVYSIVRGAARPALVLLTVAAMACSSLQTQQDFDEALDRARKGQAKQVTAELLRRIPEMKPGQRRQAVATLAKIEGPDAQAALIQLLSEPTLPKSERVTVMERLIERGEKGSAEALLTTVKGDHSYFSGSVERYLIRKDPPDLAKVLLDITRKTPARLTEPMLTQFGKSQYKPAIKDIVTALDKGRFPLAGARSLGKMDDKEADDYLYKTASVEKHPARDAALVTIFESRGAKRPAETRTLLYRTLDNYKTEERMVVAGAIDGTPRLAKTKQARKKLIAIYKLASLPEHRSRALRSLSAMEGADPYIVSRDIHTRLISVQTRMNRYEPDGKVRPRAARRYRRRTYRRPRRRGRIDVPRGRKVIGPEKHKRRPNDWTPRGWYPQNAKKYRAHFYKHLLAKMPQDDARMVYSRVSVALRSYSESDSSAAQFIRRAYRRHFRVDDGGARALMARGLRKAGAVHAVLNGIHREYPNDPLRTYALSQLFGIARWQSSMLLEYIK